MTLFIAGPDCFEAMAAHTRWEAPMEACGLLAVDDAGVVRFVYCLENAHQSDRTFTIDPAAFFGAASHAERHGWRIGGLFHSHPGGRPALSASDLRQAPSADWWYVVATLSDLRAYRLVQGRPVPVRMVVAGGV